MLKKYGLTWDERKEMLKAQEFKCAICNSDLEEFSRFTHVDHCHKINKVRGILCNHCNTGLGSFKDNIQNLEKAKQYLRKHNEEIT